ncbi:MAG: class I SAM-dependent methyltransferase [Candidatus Hermodarchaeota archaeon]
MKIKNKITSIGTTDTFSKSFNTPIKFFKDKWYVNERIIEHSFVLNRIDFDGKGQQALEFGCTKSYLAIQLASLGYNVVAIDLRNYIFDHPNLTFYQENILNLDEEETFDLITAISVLEHIGLGAYGEEKKDSDLINILKKISKLLKPKGKFIATFPFGQKYEDKFIRTFTSEDIEQIFQYLDITLVEDHYFFREDHKFWRGCTLDEAKKISNAIQDRGPTGVNCIGCFLWRK